MKAAMTMRSTRRAGRAHQAMRTVMDQKWRLRRAWRQMAVKKRQMAVKKRQMAVKRSMRTPWPGMAVRDQKWRRRRAWRWATVKDGAVGVGGAEEGGWWFVELFIFVGGC
jgi:hypothetical protein